MPPFTTIRSLVVLLVFLCAIVPGSSGAGQAPAGLELDLRIDKASYELGDRVVAYLIFRNRSPDPIVVNVFCMLADPSDCDFRFAVKTPSGRAAPPAAVREPTFPGFFTSRFILVPPGQTGSQEVDVGLYAKFEEEGAYSVEAGYTNRYAGQALGKPVWVGQLRSPTRSFKMVK